MSEQSVFGFTLLKDGLFFDVDDKKGLEASINELGLDYAIIGITEASNGRIPIEFDGFGFFYNGTEPSYDYIISLSRRCFDTHNNNISLSPIEFYHLPLISHTIGFLFNQTSILLVLDGKPYLRDVAIRESSNLNLETLNYAISLLVSKNTHLLNHIRKDIGTYYQPPE